METLEGKAHEDVLVLVAPTVRAGSAWPTSLARNRTAATASAAVDPEPYPAINGDTWIGPWPEREWLIPGWLPVGRLGMLSGRGGRGKSRLALQLAARIAALPAARGALVPEWRWQGDWAAVRSANLELDATHSGPVVYVSWEDEREEAGRRIAQFGADRLAVPDALAGRLRYLDLRGEGPLWGPFGEGRSLAAVGDLTSAGRRVRATCEALGARLLILDSLAGAYGSDENVRALVRLFCASWDRWATDKRCAVMLIAHPPKTAAGAGIGQVDRDYAGSTDWHGASRWRWTLDPADTGEAAPCLSGVKTPPKTVEALALSLAKSSYGPGGRRLFLEPSASGTGWLGVSSARAAQQAVAAQQAMEGGDEDAIRW